MNSPHSSVFDGAPSTDLHLHLFGCLTAEDLWEMGKRRHGNCALGLRWYQDQYAKAYGVAPPIDEFWRDDERGLELLRQHYELHAATPFPQFQARFNLIIALCSNRFQDAEVMTRVFQRHDREELTYAEYRLLFPYRLPVSTVADYFHYLATTVRAWSEHAQQLRPRLVISLSREPELGLQQYEALKQWLRREPELADAIVGVDFCGDEEPHSPVDLAPLLTRLHQDNTAEPRHALAALVHVGESFQRTHLRTAVQRVAEAASLGAHRLGHALALGIAPEQLLGTSGLESRLNLECHVTWLRQHVLSLSAAGYDRCDIDIQRYEQILTDHPPPELPYVYAEDDIESLSQLQGAVMSGAVSARPVIESCPTSNRIIAQLPSYEAHPLPRFQAAGWPVILGADDPGIFASTLANEAEICRKSMGCSRETMQAMAELSRQSASPIMTGRAPNLSTAPHSW